MKPEFPRIEKAIELTLDYFEKGQIIEYMEAYTRMAKGGSSNSYKVDNWEELLYTLHNRMENEILQTVNTTNKNTQVIMFEELREWLDIDWRLKAEPNGSYFWKVVDEHNVHTNSDLEQRLEIEVGKFRDTKYFKTLGENEEYEESGFRTPIWALGSRIPYKEKKLNRKYYCNDLPANFLDYYQVKKYKDFVMKIVGNFRKKIEKHLKLFDEGKYVALQEIAIYKEQNRLNPPVQKLIEAPRQAQGRIRTNVTVKQLMYFFKALIDTGIITEPSEIKTLHEMISNSFTTNKSEDISLEQLQKKWSEIKEDPKLAAYWQSKFIDLHNQAKKDNPNSVKY